MFPTAIRPYFVALVVLLIAHLSAAEGPKDKDKAPTKFNEATIAQLQDDMNSGRLTSEELVEFYLERIEVLDPGVNAIIELNPDARKLAKMADDIRRRQHGQGNLPLLGIPLLLKDNIDTGDKMQTTAGSFVLNGCGVKSGFCNHGQALQDSTVAAQLRNNGAVILGKTTLSEWAN